MFPRWSLIFSHFVFAAAANGQLIRGSVRDAESREIVRSAFVALLDSSAAILTGVSVSNRGRFSLVVPVPGVYAVATVKDGYVRQVSGWIEVSAIDTIEVTVRLARLANTLSAVLIEAERDSIRRSGILGLSSRAINGTIVSESEVAIAAVSAHTAYDLVESLHIPSLVTRIVQIDGPMPRVLPGTYRCIAYRRTNGCVTVVMNGQRYSSLSDLLQIDGTIGAGDISYLVFLRPEEAGTLYGSETINGVLIVGRKGEHR